MKLKRIEIPHEPAEKVLTRDHLVAEENKLAMLDDFIKFLPIYSPLTGQMEEGYRNNSVSFQEVLRDLVKEGKIEKEVVDILSEVMGREL